MEQRKLSDLSDKELLEEAKKRKSTSIIDAVFIGFLIGILFYSAVNNSLGFFSLIPLYLAYRFFTKPKPDSKELENLLRERRLK